MAPSRRSASRGSALLYVIASIVLLGVLGGGVAYFSSSSSVTQLADTRAKQAYYAALAGKDYVVWLHKNFADIYKDAIPKDQRFTEFLAMLNRNGGTRVLDGNRRFTIAAAAAPAMCATCYTASVDGKYVGGDGAETETFRVASVGVGGSDDPFVPGGDDDDDEDGDHSALDTARRTPTVTNGASIDGGVYADTVTLGNESAVKGDVISSSWVIIGNKAAVGGDVCAGDDVTMNNQSSVGGDINTPGDVYIGANDAVVEGSVYAGGNVTIQNGARVMGDVHAGGYVYLGSNNASVRGGVYAAGNVTLGNAARVYANVHSGGAINVLWGGRIDGNAVAAGAVTVNKDGGRVGGSVSPNTASPPRVKPTPQKACDVVAAPPLQSFTAGKTDIAVSYGNSKDIAPGTYGKLTGGGQNTITLHAGTYVFSSMSLAWNCVWRLDVSGGDIVVFSVGDVSFGGEMAVMVSPDGVNYQGMWSVDPNLAASVYLETHGSFTAGQNGRWLGTILAKKDISFGGGAEPGNKAKVIGLLSTVDGKITLSDRFVNILVASHFATDHW
jgi:cytoskeletal protein CcmA (bactofilin family)